LWLIQALQALTLEQRSVAILRVVQSLSVADAAFVLRLSEERVNRLQREALQALNRLRKPS